MILVVAPVDLLLWDFFRFFCSRPGKYLNATMQLCLKDKEADKETDRLKR